MANEYASLAELKEARRIAPSDTEDDASLQRALTRASRAIDSRTGRRFYSDGAASERVYSRQGRVTSSFGGEALLVDDIASTTGLSVLGVSASDLSFWPDNALTRGRPITLIARTSWYGTAPVRVTADWGWPEIPEEIKEATLLLANRRFMRRNSPEGVSGWATEGAIQVSRFDPDVEDLIAPYFLHGFGA